MIDDEHRRRTPESYTHMVDVGVRVTTLEPTSSSESTRTTSPRSSESVRRPAHDTPLRCTIKLVDSGDTRSDVDIFVVRPADVLENDPGWRGQLDVLSDHVYHWTGNHAGLAEVSAADIRRLRRQRPPVVDELRRDAITLVGPVPTELFGATS